MKTRNLKTKTLSILLAMVMLLGMLPMSVFAAEPEVEKEYNYATLYTDGTLKITHNNFSSLISIMWSEDAEKIKKVEFADDLNITAIPKQAFQHCVNLTEITIPDSVTSIGERAFSECTSLKNITIPENVIVIDKFAFNRCETLVSISIPDGVESISNGAFNQCYALTTVIIPDSVTSIGEGAFSNCRALASITIPDSVSSIGGRAFKPCPALTYINYNGTVESWNSITKVDAIQDGVKINHTGSCAADSDHICDLCGERVGTHTDADKDHICDYGCTVAIGTCEDTDKDHDCDYGCGKVYGIHEDTNTDHTCDYGCSVAIGAHADSDTDADHVCDYGCGVTLENCTDAVNDNNHSCNVCGKTDVSTHTYGNATCEAPATCSECGATTGDALGHKDENTDHTCDRSCGKTDMGTHAQATGKHTCDYCGATMSNCKDDDENHICDICGAELTHDYSTEWKSDGTYHWHECSCGAKADEAAHNGGTATCTDKAKCVVCAEEYGELAAHTYGTEWKSDGTNHWHECSCGEKKDTTAHTGGTATCKDKAVCSACGTVYGELAAHTYENGKCTVCEVADPNYVPETDSPQTGDNSHMALWIALLFISGGAVITLTVVDRKRRNTVKH